MIFCARSGPENPISLVEKAYKNYFHYRHRTPGIRSCPRDWSKNQWCERMV